MIALWVPLLTLLVWLRGRVITATFGEDARNFAERLNNAGPLERSLWLLSAMIPVLLPWIVACGVGGGVITRFGGMAGRRNAAYAGVCAALLACVVAAFGHAFDTMLALFASVILLSALGAAASWFGGRVADRRAKSV